MFKKLKNRFLIINIVTISIMMVISFVTILIITYTNVDAEVKGELRRTSGMDRESRKNFPNGMRQKPVADEQGHLPPVDERPTARKNQPSLSFLIGVSKDGLIISKSSFFNMEDEFYILLKENALQKKNSTGYFTIDKTTWAYQVWDTQKEFTRIAFVDATNQMNVLRNLVGSFAVVALVTFGFIIMISKYFATKAIEPVEEAFKRQKQFTADASHELKTPIAIIKTNCDVLLSNQESTIKDQKRWLDYIKTETDRMSKLINDLLYLAKTDYTEAQQIYCAVDTNEIVNNAVLSLEAVAFEKSLAIDSHFENMPLVTGNKEQLVQVMMILLDNAIKYATPDTTIDVYVKRSGKSVLLSVVNTGCGIPDTHIEKIFDRFYRVDESRVRETGGYGLGLSIAKNIVHQHGGKIYAKNTDDGKTGFYLLLKGA